MGRPLHVSFNAVVVMHEIPNIGDTTKDELDARWYSADDFHAMKDRDIIIEKELAKKDGNDGTYYHENHYFVHGIENDCQRRRRKYAMKRSKSILLNRQKSLWNLLLQQQQQQQHDDDENFPFSPDKATIVVDALAEIYSASTSESKLLARKRGVAMAEHVVQGEIKSADEAGMIHKWKRINAVGHVSTPCNTCNNTSVTMLDDVLSKLIINNDRRSTVSIPSCSRKKYTSSTKMMIAPHVFDLNKNSSN